MTFIGTSIFAIPDFTNPTLTRNKIVQSHVTEKGECDKNNTWRGRWTKIERKIESGTNKYNETVFNKM